MRKSIIKAVGLIMSAVMAMGESAVYVHAAEPENIIADQENIFTEESASYEISDDQVSNQSTAVFENSYDGISEERSDTDPIDSLNATTPKFLNAYDCEHVMLLELNGVEPYGDYKSSHIYTLKDGEILQYFEDDGSVAIEYKAGDTLALFDSDGPLDTKIVFKPVNYNPADRYTVSVADIYNGWDFNDQVVELKDGVFSCIIPWSYSAYAVTASREGFGWVKEDATHIRYMENGQFLKNCTKELTWFDGNDGLYIGEWTFDNAGYALSGVRNGKYYNEHTNNSFPYGIRMEFTIGDAVNRINTLRASSRLSEYDFVDSVAENDISEVVVIQSSIANFKSEFKALMSVIFDNAVTNSSFTYYSGATGILRGSLEYLMRFPNEYFAEVAECYMKDQERCEALLSTIVNNRFNNSTNGLSSAMGYKVVKLSKSEIIKDMKSAFKEELEAETKRYKAGQITKSDYKAVLEVYNEKKYNTELVNTLAGSLDAVISTGTEYAAVFKNYKMNIEFLESIRDNAPSGSCLRTAAENAISRYNNRFCKAFSNTFITVVNEKNGWYNLFNGTSFISNIPKLSDYADTNVNNYFFWALDKFAGTPFGRIDGILEILRKSDSVSAVDTIANSCFLKNDAIQTLKNTEARLINNPDSEDCYYAYYNAFYLAKEFTLLQYTNMNKFYNAQSPYKMSERNQKKAYCEKAIENLKSMGIDNYTDGKYASPTYAKTTYYGLNDVFVGWQGGPLKNQWVFYDDKVFFVDSDGHPIDGYRELFGNKYYFSKGTGARDQDKDMKGVLQRNKPIYLTENDFVAPLNGQELAGEYFAGPDGRFKINETVFSVNGRFEYDGVGKRKLTQQDKWDSKLGINRGSRSVTNCPVDITVYDNSGSILAKIENNTVTASSDGVTAYIDENDQKIIYVTKGSTYSVELTATGDGTMDFSVADATEPEYLIRYKTDYRNVEIHKGDVFIGTVSTDGISLTAKKEDADETIYPDEEQEGLCMYNVVPECVGDGSVSGGGYTIRGDFVMLTATPYEGSSFLGWYDNQNTLLSNDPEYRFAVLDGSTITARFSGDFDVLTSDLPASGQIPDGIWAYVEDAQYTGSAVIPDFRLYDGSTLLVNKTDYTVSIKNNKKAYVIDNPETLTDAQKKAAPQIIFKMKGNYSGLKVIYFTINPVPVTEEVLFDVSLNTGKKSKLTVMYNGKALKENTDYTVDELTEDNVVISGIGNFTGTHIYPLNDAPAGIVRVPMSKVIVDPIPVQYYTGTPLTINDLKVGESGDFTFDFRVCYPAHRELKEGVDYKVVGIRNSINSGTASIIIRGLKADGKEGADSEYSFVGEKIVNFRIDPMPIDQAEVTYSGDPLLAIAKYDKSGAKLTGLIVKVRGKVLKEGRDYIAKYSANTTFVGNGTYSNSNPKLVLTGKGNYKNSKNVNLWIEKKSFSAKSGITVVPMDRYAGKKPGDYATTVKVFDSEGKLLKAGVDYEKEIKYYTADGNEAGKDTLPVAGEELTVSVTGKGGYTDAVIKASYRILNTGEVSDISKASISIDPISYVRGYVSLTESNADKVHAVIGKDKKPLTFSTDGVNGDFMVLPGSYVNNNKAGSAKVTFVGINGYSGIKTVSFKIGTRSIVDWWR